MKANLVLVVVEANCMKFDMCYTQKLFHGELVACPTVELDTMPGCTADVNQLSDLQDYMLAVVGMGSPAIGIECEQNSEDCTAPGTNLGTVELQGKAGIDVDILTLQNFQRYFGRGSEDFEKQGWSRIALLVACLLSVLALKPSHQLDIYCHSSQNQPHRLHCRSSIAYVSSGCSSIHVCLVVHIAVVAQSRICESRWL